ncbi:DUF411 domain-containing protein [Vibrio sp. SCSIO 43137]|uniref:DUF411 domain-containing protein n=1 Tax=Vibrio sp. SCSIO 43137 TaxID=3021011 RepID=UPI002307C164|nr:DUF411 domain-containing protein [Vibrio sp. SCSIO 43137]WCE30541.1 DUF411 domain-containing protein [Vibrio sp. SCSIO 43137]
MNFKKISLIFLLSLTSTGALANSLVNLYKSPSCGCCTVWADILEKKGFQIEVHHQNQWNSIKQKHGLPSELVSCHTAIIDGYLIEGHVPASEIERLLAEKPDNIAGLSAPGMPQYSPGMAGKEGEYKGFDVVAFDSSGKTWVYKSY